MCRSEMEGDSSSKNKIITMTTPATSNNSNIDDNVEVSIPSPAPQDEDKEASATTPTRWQRLVKFYWTNEFLILIILAIALARAYPPLGAVYLAPKITASWIAVIISFLVAGLGLKTEEFSKAFQQIRFNAFVQTYNFGVISVVVFLVSRLLIKVNAMGEPLADGMVICSTLPITINMVCVLTKAAGGNEAASIFNAAFGNMIGVFLSPALILGYLGVSSGVNFLDVLYKLCLRVVAPVIVGQILQKFSKIAMGLIKKYKSRFSQIQQYCLVYIVYTVFCTTFSSPDTQSSIGDVFLMIFFQTLLLVFFMAGVWVLLGWFFPRDPGLRVMGLYGATQKTVAMGIPMINAIYETSPFVGQYTLPLLIWHPMQLLLGSFLVPRLLAFVQREKERLGINDDDDVGGVVVGGGGGVNDEGDNNNKDTDKDSSNNGEGDIQTNEAKAVDEEMGAPASNADASRNETDAAEAAEDENAKSSISILAGSY